MRIFTHRNVDLDACMSVAAAREFIPGAAEAVVEFTSANWDGEGAAPDDLILDIYAGGKGIKGDTEDGSVHSCFSVIMEKYASPEDREALETLITFVDTQDRFGSVAKHLLKAEDEGTREVFARTGLNAVLRAIQSATGGDDVLVVERMTEIFRGLLRNGRARRLALEEAQEIAERYKGLDVAVVWNARHMATNGILFEKFGFLAIVYVDGLNLGVVRNSIVSEPRMDHQEILKVVARAGEESEWFAHTGGFLYCRGSRKSRVKTPSKVDPEMLALGVIRAFRDSVVRYAIPPVT